MATKPEIERLAVLETKVDALQTTAQRIESKLDGLDSKFALKDEVKKLKIQTIPLTVITTAIITALIYYFVNNVGGK